MHDDAKHDPLFEAVKQMVIKTRTPPSIALTQRTFLIGYPLCSPKQKLAFCQNPSLMGFV